MRSKNNEQKCLFCAKTERKLTKVENYYFLKNGLLVFTEAYHFKRGFCCKNRCKTLSV
ncbi:MAG: DUF5522 domain-containing protein [Cyclobacteriaceae bacterium]|nr:DUF5522 domain-containing protein [Cyclobacteriaceae bacterium]